jgi:hypothetical protein
MSTPSSGPEDTAAGSVVHLSVSKDGATGRLQLSIGNEVYGYRIAGPKFNGSSKEILGHKLSERDALEIAGYVRGVVMDPAVQLVPQVYGHPLVDWVRQTRASPALYEAVEDSDSTYAAVLAVCEKVPELSSLAMVVEASRRKARTALSSAVPSKGEERR